MKIAVVLRKGIEKNNISVEQFFKFAEKYGIDCDYLASADFDLLVTFGGDGTTLHYAKKYIDKPIIAVNMGHIGFLSQIQPTIDSYSNFFRQLKSGEFTIVDKTMLDLSINNKHYYALNDIMLCSINRGRTIRVQADLNGNHVNVFNCDGIIVSTPTGSTAHNLSCGGSAVTGDSKVFCLTPISCINSNVPLIYSDGGILVLKSVKEQISLYADGDLLADSADQITIKKSSKPAKFLQLRDSFFEKLRTKNVQTEIV